VALDPIMIFALDMGCTGAALATILSQAVSFALCLGFLLSNRSQVRIRAGGYSLKVMARVLKYGFSPFIILATDSVVIIALNSVLQRHGGAQAELWIAAATITQSYMQLITMPLLGLTGGTQPLLSFNLGACALDRIREGMRMILKFGLIFTAAMFVASQFLPSLFARIFTRDPELISASVRAIRAYTLCVVPMTLQYCFVDALTALGVPHISMALSLTRKVNMTAWTILLPLLGMGAFSAFYAEPIADLCAGVLSTLVFRKTFEPLLARRSMTGGEPGR
ncbi:MAG: MATE family efflux transporter, partial [Clostridia bacterium]|nr:MATE family efflux transporter [Clostridia bacterium]